VYYHRGNVLDLAEMLVSLMHMCGENEDLYNKLNDLYQRIVSCYGYAKIVGKKVYSDRLDVVLELPRDAPPYDYFREFQVLDYKTMRDRALRMEYGRKFGLAKVM